MIVKVALTLFAELAVMLAAVVEATVVVVTAKEPLDEPAGIVIEPGTVAAISPLDKLTRTPPAPAGADSVTVPVEPLPPVTVVGESERLPIVPGPGAGALRVSVALTLLAEVAEIVTGVVEETVVVLMLNVPLEDPEAIVIDPGTVAAMLPLESVTRTPPAPAGADKVTVPIEPLPPVTVAGDNDRLPIVP